MSSYRRVLRWYPARWRDRYGEELTDLLEARYGDRGLPLRIKVELACAGGREWWYHLGRDEGHGGGAMDTPLIYRISRVTPPVLSLVALAACVAASAGWVTNPPRDEGTLAHIYQLVMVAQCPVIGLFVLTALRRGLLRDLAIFGGAQLTLLTAAIIALPVFKL